MLKLNGLFKYKLITPAPVIPALSVVAVKKTNKNNTEKQTKQQSETTAASLRAGVWRELLCMKVRMHEGHA